MREFIRCRSSPSPRPSCDTVVPLADPAPGEGLDESVRVSEGAESATADCQGAAADDEKSAGGDDGGFTSVSPAPPLSPAQAAAIAAANYERARAGGWRRTSILLAGKDAFV